MGIKRYGFWAQIFSKSLECRGYSNLEVTLNNVLKVSIETGIMSYVV